MVIKHQQTSIRKKQIANAARRILIKKGSKELTIRAIAKIVGITEGTIYQHVKSKKEILSLIVDITSEEILNDFKVVPGDGDLSLDKLDSIVRGYISTADEDKDCFKQLHNWPRRMTKRYIGKYLRLATELPMLSESLYLKQLSRPYEGGFKLKRGGNGPSGNYRLCK